MVRPPVLMGKAGTQLVGVPGIGKQHAITAVCQGRSGDGHVGGRTVNPSGAGSRRNAGYGGRYRSVLCNDVVVTDDDLTT